jgi:uncharacterized protein YbcI
VSRGRYDDAPVFRELWARAVQAGRYCEHLISDPQVARLHGVPPAAEQQLVKTFPADKGRDLLNQVRTQLIDTARPVPEALVQDATGVKVLSLHHDISTVAGEEVVLFTSAAPPQGRDSKKKLGMLNRGKQGG